MSEKCPTDVLKLNENWKCTASISTFCSMVLPFLNEFPEIADGVLMGVGGTSAVAVGAIMMKIANVTVVAGDIADQQKVDNEEFMEEHKDMVLEKRQRLIDSDYIHDI